MIGCAARALQPITCSKTVNVLPLLAKCLSEHFTDIDRIGGRFMTHPDQRRRSIELLQAVQADTGCDTQPTIELLQTEWQGRGGSVIGEEN
jgi:hypothetical protein